MTTKAKITVQSEFGTFTRTTGKPYLFLLVCKGLNPEWMKAAIASGKYGNLEASDKRYRESGYKVIGWSMSWSGIVKLRTANVRYDNLQIIHVATGETVE
jgi:hypothetical protein